MTDSIRPSTRDALLEAAFQVLAAAPRASLSDIAARAGVGRATLHRHFPGRYDLIRALAHRAIQEIDKAAESASADAETYAAALENTLEALIPLGDRYGFLMRESLDDDPQVSAQFARQTRETKAAIEQARKEGAFDPNVPTAWIAEVYDHLLFAGWEAVKAGELTTRQATELAWRTLMSGVGARR